MQKTSWIRGLTWWTAIIPYIAAACFPMACLQYVSSVSADRGHEHHAMILIVWFALAISSVAGIAISLQRGSKHQQLVALVSIPAFVPVTAFSFLMLYWFGYWGMSPL